MRGCSGRSANRVGRGEGEDTDEIMCRKVHLVLSSACVLTYVLIIQDGWFVGFKIVCASRIWCRIRGVCAGTKDEFGDELITKS